jgi:hypothetical protein
MSARVDLQKGRKVDAPSRTETLAKLAVTPTIGAALRLRAIKLLIPIANVPIHGQDIEKETAIHQAISALFQVAPFLDDIIEHPPSKHLLRSAMNLKAQVRNLQLY